MLNIFYELFPKTKCKISLEPEIRSFEADVRFKKSRTMYLHAVLLCTVPKDDNIPYGIFQRSKQLQVNDH